MAHSNLEQVAIHEDWSQDRLDAVLKQQQIAAEQKQHFTENPTQIEREQDLSSLADNTRVAHAAAEVALRKLSVETMALDPNMDQDRLDAISSQLHKS